jgi:hypothetical protein
MHVCPASPCTSCPGAGIVSSIIVAIVGAVILVALTRVVMRALRLCGREIFLDLYFFLRNLISGMLRLPGTEVSPCYKDNE